MSELQRDPDAWLSTVHPEDPSRVLDRFLTNIAHSPHSVEYRLVRPDGSVPRAWNRSFSVRDSEGQVAHIVGIVLDMTEHKRAEETRAYLAPIVQSSGDAIIGKTLEGSVASWNSGGRLEESSRLVKQCLDEVRTISYLMHPPLLDELGLVPALRWYVEGFRTRSGIRTNVQITPELCRLPREAEIALFRIVQESLTNIHRHSGSATAEVRFIGNSTEVTLEIIDRGCGMPTESLDGRKGIARKVGVGISSMRERAKQIGGNLEIDSSPRGTTVRVKLPAPGSQS